MDETEGAGPKELLRDNTAQEDVPGDDTSGHDVKGMAKEIGKTEGDDPERMPRGAISQEDITADDADDNDPRETAGQESSRSSELLRAAAAQEEAFTDET